MSRAGSEHERELLRGAKRSKLSDGKACASSACSELGKVQLNENFYRRGRGLDSYCIMCRRAANSTWKFNNPGHVSAKPKKRREGSLNVGKAPWCAQHSVNSNKCGCALGVFHKSPAHRKAIAKAMVGNTNARGKKNRHGALSTAHKLAISMTMRGRKR